MNILLIEPAYKNKYPPLSLMKISTYHKNKGDQVFFCKGLIDNQKKWDRIYITTLFTFHYNHVIKTINYYKKFVNNTDDIYVGGIMASLMSESIKKDTGIKNVIIGRLFDSSLLGFTDKVNIDILPLDYDILNDTEYIYPSGDNFFAYTTRGCVNKCPFCAVPILEGNLSITNNIVDQIDSARSEFGDKRNLLLLDNNILALDNAALQKIINDIKDLGFIKQPTFIKPSQFKILYDNYCRQIKYKNDFSSIKAKILDLYKTLCSKTRLSKKETNIIMNLENQIGTLYEDTFMMILDNIDQFIAIESKHKYKKAMQRYVDFNQGMDGRLLTEDKMKILSQIPIRPFRIAFDNIKYTDIYLKAIKLAAKYNVYEFSNYLLYNFEDKPFDLYTRLKLNIELSSELNVHIYSFPMKYEPIQNKKRGYVGTYWNNYYLRSIKAILNVSKGVFSGTLEFFYKAFGRNEEEFYEILSMPKELITYRVYYEEIGITKLWKNQYRNLSDSEKSELLYCLSNKNTKTDNSKINKILKFYDNNIISYKKKIVNFNLLQ